MGCISCKTVDPTKNKNLAGKARLPGIPKKEKKNRLLRRKKILAEINPVDIYKEKAKILQQLEEENIIAKKTSGGVAYVFGGDDTDQNQIKPKRPPQRLQERWERPSTSARFNSEEKEMMAECLKNESLQEKGRLARLSEQRRFIAEMNREKALRLKAMNLEMKLRKREQIQDETKKRKEQETLDASTRNYEKQEKAKCRRFNLEQEENYKKKIQEEIRKKKQQKENGNNFKSDFRKDNGMPGVDM